MHFSWMLNNIVFWFMYICDAMLEIVYNCWLILIKLMHVCYWSLCVIYFRIYLITFAPSLPPNKSSTLLTSRLCTALLLYLLDIPIITTYNSVKLNIKYLSCRALFGWQLLFTIIIDVAFESFLVPGMFSIVINLKSSFF